MKVDYISDVHVDMYPINNSAEVIADQLAENRRSEIIVVSGDISNSLDDGTIFLNRLRDYWEHVIFVPGNHDLYLKGVVKPGEFLKMELREEIYREYMEKLIRDGVHLLFGDYIEIDGTVFWGHPVLYGKDCLRKTEKSLKTEEDVDRRWGMILSWITDRNSFLPSDLDKYHENARCKLAEALDRADVIITHSNPSIREEHINPKYQGEPVRCCFIFDGLSLLKEGQKARHWFFGHVHDPIEWEENGVKFHCNPYGYGFERNEKRIKTLSL